MSWTILLLAYLCGSIPFGYLIVRLKSGTDIRQSGSGATGANNVTRTAGKGAGILTLFLDALKGAVAVLLARWLAGDDGTPWVVAGAGILAVVGHCFPVWLSFKAGKGVATALGVFLVLAPLPVSLSLGVFIITVVLTRYVSLGSILAAVATPGWALLGHYLVRPLDDFVPLMATLCGVAVLVITKHYENIGRLLAGTESGFRSGPKS
ncbi:MAG: glycerol-3-phosphate 1-O-acyltransferase [Acidobacteria bacterium]|nr:glycerol-3-phosphate 1-O-acyltransferase [Acidobacteriota bacterium]